MKGPVPRNFQLGGVVATLPGGAAGFHPCPRSVSSAAPSMLTSPEAIRAMVAGGLGGGAVHGVTFSHAGLMPSPGKTGEVTGAGAAADRAAAATRAAIDPNRPPLGCPALSIIPGGLR